MLSMIDVREEIANAPIGRYHRFLALLIGMVVFFDGYDTFNPAYVIHYVAKPWHLAPGQAGLLVSSGLIGFMIGRFTGSWLMKSIRASRLLAFFAFGALVCAVIATSTTGVIPIYAVVLIGFFHSIMFPTIFALGIKNLGPFTKRGSSLLVMAIIGAAVVPPVMGKISDLSNIQRAFLVPLFCYAYVFYFAVRGYKPAAEKSVRETVATA